MTATKELSAFKSTMYVYRYFKLKTSLSQMELPKKVRDWLQARVRGVAGNDKNSLSSCSQHIAPICQLGNL